MGPQNRAMPTGKGTEFSRFIRQTRTDVLRLTQDQFLEKLTSGKRYNKQYLSKIESGKILEPADDFLRAVEEITRTSYEQLRKMCGVGESVELPTALRPFDLAFGHDLRGAALYLALTDKETRLPQRFRSTSKGFIDPATPGWNPAWNDGDPTVSTGANHESYAAPDVVKALMEKWIDVGAFPANVLEDSASRQGELMVLATMVNSTGPINFVVNPHCSYSGKFIDALKAISPGSSDSLQSLDTNMLGRIIKILADARRNDPSHAEFKIAVEIGTVAERALEDACEYARGFEGGKSINMVTLGFPSKNAWLLYDDFEALAMRDAKKAHSMKGDKKARCEWLLGAITWQPHATILTQKLENKKMRLKDDSPFNLILNRSAASTGRPRHMSYDLIVRRDSLTDRNAHQREFRDALIELIAAIQTKSAYLNENVGRHKLLGKDVEDIADYYKFDSADKAAEALETILFDVQLSVSSLEALRAI